MTRFSRHAWQFWLPNVAAEVDEELQFHLDARVADYMAQGLSHAEAVEAARTRVGDLGRIQQTLVTHGAARERRYQRRETMHRFAQQDLP